MAKKTSHHDKPIIDVEETLSRTEDFVEKNKTILTIIIVAIVVIVGGYFLYRNYYVIPREKQSQNVSFM
ncbi:MAG: hypothetical protein KKA07_09625, partial [Bacteroidetes bacterium]|nr:hypothetical protein [Bacteroidota bacterium]